MLNNTDKQRSFATLTPNPRMNLEIQSFGHITMTTNQIDLLFYKFMPLS